MLLGGRAAEKIILNDISTGASNDIERASKIARQMVTKFGMSDKIGPISFGNESNEVFLGKDFVQSRSVSERVASEIDDEIMHIIETKYEECLKLISENKDKLECVAAALMEREKLSGEEFEILFAGNKLPPMDPLNLNAEKSAEEKTVENIPDAEIHAKEEVIEENK